MDGGVEAVGDAITGGLVARLVEPTAGQEARNGGGCLNCGAALIGDYCHACGQKTHVHRTLSAFWHDLLHGVLHFEGKIWRTLPMLVWKPGELTRRYIEGERTRFVSPLAMFLFSVFLTFALIGSIGRQAYRSRNAPVVQEEHKLVGESPFDVVEILQGEAKKEREENVRELEALRRARAELLAAGKNSRVVDVDMATFVARRRLRSRSSGRPSRSSERPTSVPKPTSSR